MDYGISKELAFYAGVKDMTNEIARYKNIMNGINGDTKISTLADQLTMDTNKLLVALYELKSLGWVESEDAEVWRLSTYGSRAINLLSQYDVPLSNKAENGITVLLTLPREFGDVSTQFPLFIDIAKVFKNELKMLERGGEVLILSYSIDFNVLGQILEDPELIAQGKEREIFFRIQYFYGYNEGEITKLNKNGFKIASNKITMIGPGHPHAKLVIFKNKLNKSMIISSANLTDNFFKTRNMELGVLTNDKKLIDEIERFYSWIWTKTSLE